MSNQQILHIAGWNTCGFYRRASTVLGSLSVLFPAKLKVVEHSFPSRADYRAWLIDGNFRDCFSDSRARGHTASPFVWFSGKASAEPSKEDVESFLGGHDDTLEWCRNFCSPCETGDVEKATMVDDGHSIDHDYDYDLVVIGGGSGGLAASKEAASLGAKVAVLDYVKPSPHGTTWGLGGTCVNVGCIPKKLMHQGALLNEAIELDTGAFGINKGDLQPHTWEEMRLNVQNFIRSLNFKYRVTLREKNVHYLNKLGRFIDAHTLEVRDKKGKVSTITSSRFLVATGGRPTPLACEGGELAISSDDIFAMEKSPGKVLCVGASYISLECAGFLAGLGHDVTVGVRSILLRGFDRECVDKIGTYMEAHNVAFKRGVTPTKLEKTANDQIQVTFSDGSQDVYDTVLAAIGRMADTPKLNLEALNVETNAKNGKIICKYEQTSCPNIYAIGDVMEGCPELTPVAIQAGIFLARRLFGTSTQPMDYVNICTTVFTPLEYSCVGLSEDDSIDKFGPENIEVYQSSFMPLEWSLSSARASHNAFTKVIVNKSDQERVLGIHYLGPNAGEVMQGYGAAIKKGLTFKDLSETVGIHPTSAEEIVTLSITKSSGADCSAGSC